MHHQTQMKYDFIRSEKKSKNKDEHKILKHKVVDIHIVRTTSKCYKFSSYQQISF